MTIKTAINSDDLVEISQNYGIQFAKFSVIESGTENSNFILFDQSGKKYILTIFEDRIDQYGIEFCLKYQDFLSENGNWAPSAYTNKAGDQISKLRNKQYAVVQFIEGTHKEFDELQVSDIRRIGDAIARAHIASLNFEATRENQLFLNFLHATKDDLIWDSRPELLSSLVSGLEEIKSSKLENILPALPSGVIHTDLFEDNIFFSQQGTEERVSFIDFYFCCTGHFAFDIAVSIIALAFSEAGCYYPDRVAALLSGYTSERDLLSVEIDSIRDLALLASMRFLCTRSINILKLKSKSKDPAGCALRIEFILNHQEEFTSPIRSFGQREL